SDKGCDLLISAVSMLRIRNLYPSVTVIGTGPELSLLVRQVDTLGLSDQVRFTGPLKGEELALMLARHRILVVPSRWEEPFGIVALEGAACGCVIIGTNGGGLPEAIGPCGLTVRRGDAGALAEALQEVLTNPDLE